MHTPYIYAFADEASKEVDGQIAAMLRNGLNGLEIRGDLVIHKKPADLPVRWFAVCKDKFLFTGVPPESNCTNCSNGRPIVRGVVTSSVILSAAKNPLSYEILRR